MSISTTNMAGKVCLVTGASQGIGKSTALALAKMGAKVVIVARDKARGEAAAEDIRKESGAANDAVELLRADLSSLDSVRQLAAEFKAKHERLDVLVNNAGVVLSNREVTVDGFEKTIATNHLAYFVLTDLLLDLLKTSAPSRIVNVASDAHKGGSIHFDDLQGEKNYSGMRAYNQSKLANILYTFELAKRLEGTGVTANCVHPGVVASGFGHNNGGVLGFLVKIASPFLITPEKGAATSVYLASSPEVEKVTGKYFAKCKEASCTKEARDVGIRERLWKLTEELVRPQTATAAVSTKSSAHAPN
ncbi:MAG: SDR family oxidoreductase [Polyangiaceae bacterium]